MRKSILGVLALLFSACPLWANWGVVQQSESTFIQGTTVTAQFSTNVTPGDLLLVHVIWSDNTLAVSSIGDTLGNTYNSAALAQSSTSTLMLSTQLFYAANVNGGVDKVTVSISGTAFLNIFVYEITGAAASAPLDVAVIGTGTGLSVATAPATTSAANEFVFVGTGHHFACDTVGSGFFGLQAGPTGLDEYQAVAAAGTSVTGTSSLTATQSTFPWAVVLAAFRSNAGTGGGPPTLTSIQVTPGSPTLSMGQSVQLTATGSFSDGSTQDLTSSATWSSSQTSVVTVGTSGLATAGGHGSASITASSGSISGSTLMLVEGNLSALQLTPGNGSVTAGTTQQFTATGTFSDGTSENLTGSASWSSSNTSVGTVNASGLVTAITAGSTTIIATSGGVVSSTPLTVKSPPGVVGTPLVQGALAQTNYQWASSWYAQNPPKSGGSSCAPGPCIAQTFLNANTAGNMIFVWVSWNTNSFSLMSLSDTAGNVYTHVPGFPSVKANGIIDDFWVTYNIPGAVNNKVIGLFGSGTAKPTYLQIMEFSGIAASNALDVLSVNSTKLQCNGPCILSTAPSPSTTQASELLLAIFDFINCGNVCSSVQFTAGSGWTPDAVCTGCQGWAGNVSGAVLIEHQIVSSIGSYVATALEKPANFPNFDAYLFAFRQKGP
ncbi:MAG TPA: Ig-like domain-containing protein [Candidatus Sulfotelmatobacter sp.]|jgi:hypothetical protein|nr:Ig-like domain-containing protein [Candidatus Sulfotelmatobacter sp.]